MPDTSGGAELATAWVRLVPSIEGVQGTIAKEFAGSGIEAAGDAAGGKFTKGAKSGLKGLAAVVGGAFVVTKVVGFFKDSIDAVSEWQTLNAQTSAVVKSTGGAANVTAKEVNSLAQSIEGTTATQAESIQAGANMLLTFKNIRNETGKGNDIFNQATSSLVDMSVAMGTDPKNAAIQLGKALNDPIAGISALSRVGIQFTEDQKDQIKTLVESGKTMDAQKIILGELNSQFGGSGAANADTYAGKLFLLQDAFGDMGEAIVSAVVPALSDLFGAITPVFAWLTDNQPVLFAVAGLLGVVMVLAFYAWASSIWAANAALLANPITWIVLLIAGLVAAIIWVATQTTIFQDVWRAVSTFFIDTWNNIASFFTTVWNGIVSWFQGAIDAVVGFVRDHWGLLLSFFIGPLGLVIQWIVENWSGIVSFFQDALGNIGGFFSSVFGGIGGIVKAGFNGVVDFIRGIFNTIIRIVNGVIDGINGAAALVKTMTGGAINVHLGRLPMLAEGGTILRGGSVIVGERGPELLRLPTGASVDPDISGARSADDRVLIEIGSLVVREEADIRRVAQELYKLMKRDGKAA